MNLPAIMWLPGALAMAVRMPVSGLVVNCCANSGSANKITIIEGGGRLGGRILLGSVRPVLWICKIYFYIFIILIYLNAFYSDAAWDIRHSFTGSFLYDLPIGKGKKLNLQNKATNALLGGWQVNGIVTLRTGAPFTLGTNNCVGSFGNCTPDAISGKDPNAAPAGGRSAAQWFDISNVAKPTPGTPGSLDLQTNRIPGQHYMDLSFFKAVNLTERFKVQFRAEAFNLTNTPQYGSPNRTQGDPNFGRIFSTQDGTQRRTQFALRFMF